MKKLSASVIVLLLSLFIKNEALAISTTKSTIWSKGMDFLGSGFVLIGACIMVAIIAKSFRNKKNED
jgi:hypothetical protein